MSMCAAVPAVEAGAEHGERVQFRSADLQQHQRASQTIFAHLWLGSDQISRVSGHDPQVVLSSHYSSTINSFFLHSFILFWVKENGIINHYRIQVET